MMREVLSFLQNQSRNNPCFETKKSFIQRWTLVLEEGWPVAEISADDLGMFLTRYLLGKTHNDRLLFEITCCLPWSFVAQNSAVSSTFKKMKFSEYHFLKNEKMEWFDTLSLVCLTWFDTLSLVCLTYLWEQNRRDLFREAVEQKRWNVVKQWADHSLYDDLRWWALEEAYKDIQRKRESFQDAQNKEKQGTSEARESEDQSYRNLCEAMLFLADHGLTEAERMLAHNRLGKFADWDTMLDMFEHGADVREVREMLQAVMGKRREEKNRVVFKYSFRIASLWSLEQDLLSADESFGTILARNNWRAVLHRLRRSQNEQHYQQALHQAMEQYAWQVVIQLVRLGVDREQRDALFNEMLQLRQWDVMRELLEKGVSTQLCLDALPQLLRRKKWMLVARIMDYDVSDSLRRDVMEYAMNQREGSLVWHCMAALKICLPVKERMAMFQKAFTENNWQAVKALIDRKDETGVQHRDVALQEAIEQHRWDVVDHCQRHLADIDMKDEHGETALHRDARDRDWEGVVELVRRGADQRILDKNGFSVLHKALKYSAKGRQACDEQIKTLIQFHAPLNQTDRKLCTPLQTLIDEDKGDLIDLALMWSPDLHKGITKTGKTTLHAACASGCWHSMYYLIQRGVDPLAMTSDGETLIDVAVQRHTDAQRMLAECIKLGLSTHGHSTFPPAEFAVQAGKRVLLQMLYESGACSNRELYEIHRNLVSCASSTALSDYPYLSRNQIIGEELYARRMREMQPVIEKMATVPRSLQSTCRLVISHLLNVRGRRHREVAQLPVLDEDMKKYIMFDDLTDPTYGKDLLKWEKMQSELDEKEEERLKELHGWTDDSFDYYDTDDCYHGYGKSRWNANESSHSSGSNDLGFDFGDEDVWFQ